MDINPLFGNIILKPIPVASKIKSTLILPDIYFENHTDELREGVIISIGNGTLTKDNGRKIFDLSVGETVKFFKDAGIKFKDSGEDYIILKEDDICFAVKELA